MHSLVEKYPLASDQVSKEEVTVLLSLLERQLKDTREGDVVEFGCYVGTTSIFLQRLLLQHASKKILHVYDSFEGLPEKEIVDRSPAGEQFKCGELRASKQVLIKNFLHAGLPLPIIHKGWFGSLSSDDVPHKICFAFLDGDFYSSIRDSLSLIWPHLAEGAVVVVDDYQSEQLPGATRAVDEWLETHFAKRIVQKSLAILYPKRHP